MGIEASELNPTLADGMASRFAMVAWSPRRSVLPAPRDADVRPVVSKVVGFPFRVPFDLVDRRRAVQRCRHSSSGENRRSQTTVHFERQSCSLQSPVTARQRTDPSACTEVRTTGGYLFRIPFHVAGPRLHSAVIRMIVER